LLAHNAAVVQVSWLALSKEHAEWKT